MNPYHAFLDAQEKSYMTEDEKLVKRNSEILTTYRNVGAMQETPENMTKPETVNKKPNREKYK